MPLSQHAVKPIRCDFELFRFAPWAENGGELHIARPVGLICTHPRHKATFRFAFALGFRPIFMFARSHVYRLQFAHRFAPGEYQMCLQCRHLFAVTLTWGIGESIAH